MAFQKNTAQNIQIVCYDGETPTAPTNPVVTVSTDGGGFGAATNSPSVVGTTVHITLTASEMNGDVVAVNVASDNLEDQLEVYYAEEDYTATVAGRIDAAISSRSSHVAADIWSVGTRTLTGFGTLVSDIWSEAVRTITGGSVDDVNGSTFDDVPTAAENAAAINGTGSNAVTTTLRDGAANGVTGVRCVVYDPAEASILARGITDANGEVVFALDGGTYPVYFGPSASYAFSNPYSVTVDGVTAEEYTCEALATPAADDPAQCAVYAYIRDARGSLVGAGDGRIEVVGVPGDRPAIVDEQFAGYDEDADYAETDASGLAEIDLLRGVQYRLRITALDAEQTKTVTVPDAESYKLPVDW